MIGKPDSLGGMMREQTVFAPPRDATTHQEIRSPKIDRLLFTEGGVQGVHLYDAIEIWEDLLHDNKVAELRQRRLAILSALKMLSPVLTDPHADPNDLAAATNLVPRLETLRTAVEGNAEVVKGTDTIKAYLEKRLHLLEPERIRLLTTEQGAKDLANLLLKELYTQVAGIQASNKIYLGADIANYPFEIQTGDNTTFKALAESMQSIGGRHEAIAIEFITDVFALTKVAKLTAGMEGHQKDAKGMATYLDNVAVHLTDTERRRLLAVGGKEYRSTPNDRHFAMDIHDALVIYDAVSAPRFEDVIMPGSDEHSSMLVHNYPIKAKNSPVPQSLSGNLKTRAAVRKAMEFLRNPADMSQDAQVLRQCFNQPDTAQRKRMLKKFFTDGYRDTQNNEIKGYIDRHASPDTWNLKGAPDGAWFAELFAMNYMEGNLWTAFYDAGQVQKDAEGHDIRQNGKLIVDRFGGASATFKFTAVTDAMSAMAKYSVPGVAERGDPGPPIIRNILLTPLLPLDEYLRVSSSTDKLHGMTLRQAIVNSPSAQALEGIINSPESLESLSGADETAAGAVHEGWSFWEMFVRGMGIKFADIVTVTPFEEGLEVRVDPSIEQKLKGVSSGIEYWLYRDNMELLGYMKNALLKVNPNARRWTDELDRYRRFEQVIFNAATNNGGNMQNSVTNAITGFQTANGMSPEQILEYRNIYRKMNKQTSPDFQLKEGWYKGEPGKDDQYYSRVAERAFTRIYSIDLAQAQAGTYGLFIQEIFKQGNTIDWLRVMKKVTIGLLIIGQIQLNKEAAHIKPDDLLGLRMMLNKDFWIHEEHRFTTKLSRAINGIVSHQDFTGVGLFEPAEINALIKDAGIPDSVFTRVRFAWERIQQIKE